MSIPAWRAAKEGLYSLVLGTVLLIGFPMMGARAEVASASAFYRASKAEIAGKPGTLARIQSVPPPPGAAAAYRIIYRSRGHSGSILISGLVAIPSLTGSDGPRPIVSWGHGTTGIASSCAPSFHPEEGFENIAGLKGLLAKKYLVVATDYQGLGEDGRTGYLEGVGEARAMIDAARAIRQIPGVRVASRYATWGFSQGGHASLFAGAVGRGYAPDMLLVGVAAVSAPTELLPLMKADIGTIGGDVIASYVAWSWSKAYNAPLTAILNSRAAATVRRIAKACSLNFTEDIALGLESLAFQNEGFLKDNAAKQEEWQRLIARNSVPILRVPVFMAQGQLDVYVKTDITRDYVRRLCQANTDVIYREFPLTTHGGAAMASSEQAVEWLDARFSNRSLPTTCK
ncbi:pimeloyl-ACP methyl ester carboxylesterase [Ancylobacter sp. 3268]|uniref:lipase family protein n=1 Tax=Ancylobacter sp. 3268 TaxID=2817752 RepID=UPI0028559958|nr:lipase family protein [Ancylobacter sp. 3268]MDR6955453.1 pimeloyl-ACP methyl ester carboxylesterase [Ancylobacter sp. 3268]